MRHKTFSIRITIDTSSMFTNQPKMGKSNRPRTSRKRWFLWEACSMKKGRAGPYQKIFLNIPLFSNSGPSPPAPFKDSIDATLLFLNLKSWERIFMVYPHCDLTLPLLTPPLILTHTLSGPEVLLFSWVVFLLDKICSIAWHVWRHLWDWAKLPLIISPSFRAQGKRQAGKTIGDSIKFQITFGA